jgi:DNA polymerase I-like protein with 3'-5' exonuclease and polymerase domains
MSHQRKEEMHALALRGGPWTKAELSELLSYCEIDMGALQELLPVMAHRINWPRCTYRGRYMAAVTRMEYVSLPIDVRLFKKLDSRFDGIKEELIRKIDADYGVYTGKEFSYSLFERYLLKNKILLWPRTPKGRLELKDRTLRSMVNVYPQLSALRELRHTLKDLKMSSIVVSSDGRNRCSIMPFVTKTGRNAPPASKYIGGPSCWMRCLIKPHEGRAICYADYEQQEIAIAAALSGDDVMQADYLSGDFYLGFGKRAGRIPLDGTLDTHDAERGMFKTVTLGVNYDMQAVSLGQRLNQPPVTAAELLGLHHELYRRYWQWSEKVLNFAVCHGYLQTVFGWKCRTPRKFNPRSLRNFMMQAHGAEILRLACCLATEASLLLCGPLHDAIFLESSIEEIERDVERLKAFMIQASRIVLGGFECRVETKIFRYPERYWDKRGLLMWNTVMDLIGEADAKLEKELEAIQAKKRKQTLFA